MITAEYFNLRETADELGIESWRLARLGRYLGLAPGAKLIPWEEVQRIRADCPEERYTAVLHLLLSTLNHSAQAPLH
jgi:hypothetical protein